MLRQIKHSSIKGLKAFLLCFLSGVILTLPYINGNLWIFAWFGFLPLFIALKDKSKFQKFLLAYFTGVMFWLGTIYWLVHVTLLGMILLVLYLALYFGVFGLVFYARSNGPQVRVILFIPSAWVLLE